MEKLITFDNGIRLCLKQNDGMYSVACGLIIESGSCFENDKNNGISHFIEHTLFKGTKRRNSYEISDCIDRVGGQMNAYTTKEYTCYYTKTTPEYVELCLDLLSDMLFNSTFLEEELNKEKGVILEELAMMEDTPDDLCFELLAKAYFGDTPIGKPIGGTAENVKSFTKADILEYMARTYAPNNVIVSIAGNFDVEKAIELTEKYFVKDNNAPKYQLPVFEKVEPKSTFINTFKDIEQCHIAFAKPSIPINDPKIFAYMILGNIFGGSMTSRLFRSIREDKGLAYTVYSYNSTYKNDGAYVVYAGVNPKNVVEATKAIREEFIKLKKDKITKEEFERGKAQTIGAYLFSQENSISTMSLYGRNLLIDGEMFDMNKRIEQMNAVSYESVIDIIDEFCDLTYASAALVGKSDVDVLKVFKGEE